MSRAFVDEASADSRDEDAPEYKIPLPPGARNYVTAEGAERLYSELRALEFGERPELAGEILRLSRDPTNADALATARRRLARLDRRIEYLARMAGLAEVVNRPASGYDRVRFGARVTIRDGDGAVSAFRIVGVDESDPEAGLVGWTAPLARALMGKAPGESAVVLLPGGDKTVTVAAVE
jgi:transcription elongation factor GreB